jgi:predicted nuclease of predicted toxin-antitoxin system
MRFTIVENLPQSLAEVLTSLGHAADTVPQEGLAGRADPEVWAAAQESGRFFITQDLDFSDVRRFAPGSHHGVLLVRLRDPGRMALTARIRRLFGEHDVESWAQCFVVATDRKVRVRRPGAG